MLVFKRFAQRKSLFHQKKKSLLASYENRQYLKTHNMTTDKNKITTVDDLAAALYAAAKDVQLLISQGKKGDKDLCQPAKTLFGPISEAIGRLGMQKGVINTAYETLLVYTMGCLNEEKPDKELEARYNHAIDALKTEYPCLTDRVAPEKN